MSISAILRPLHSVQHSVRQFIQDEEAGVLEYAVLIAFIGLAVAPAAADLRDHISDTLFDIADTIKAIANR